MKQDSLLRFEKVMDTTSEEINDLTVELVNYEKIVSYWKEKNTT
jgi:pyruvate-formate lyase